MPRASERTWGEACVCACVGVCLRLYESEWMRRVREHERESERGEFRKLLRELVISRSAPTVALTFSSYILSKRSVHQDSSFSIKSQYFCTNQKGDRLVVSFTRSALITIETSRSKRLSCASTTLALLILFVSSFRNRWCTADESLNPSRTIWQTGNRIKAQGIKNEAPDYLVRLGLK